MTNIPLPGLWLLLLIFATLAQASSYDEVYSNGVLRPAYQRYIQRTGRDPLNPPRSCVHFLTEGRPLNDEIRASPYPLILSKEEYQRIQKGAAMRSKALALFFEDTVLGEEQFLRDRAPFPRTYLDTLLSETIYRNLDGLRKSWRGRTRRDITFTAGPDVMRDENGVSFVLEDNIGEPCGGIADVVYLAEAYERAWSNPASYTKPITPPRPNDWELFLTAFLRVQEIRNPTRNAMIVAPWPNPGRVKDTETDRVMEIAKGTGIPIWTLGDSPNRKVQPEHPFDRFALIDFEGGWREEFEKNPNIVVLPAPGIQALLGGKYLLPFVDDMVRFYLQEEPTLRTAPTQLFKVHFTPEKDRIIFQQAYSPKEDFPLISEYERYVFKSLDGHQGYGVDVGRWISLTTLGKRLTLVAEENESNSDRRTDPPEQANLIVQKALPGSQVHGWSVEIRPINVCLGDGEVYVFSTPWAKALSPSQQLDPKLGGRANVSLGSHELVVIIEP